jgi:Uncharacterized protein conserved in bacteria
MSPRTRYQWNASQDGDDALPPSRSQRKRDSLALQQLGETIAEAAPHIQAKLPLSDDMRAALAEYRRISSREGKRRHLQYIGRLMREEEHADTLATALGNLRAHGTVD